MQVVSILLKSLSPDPTQPRKSPAPEELDNLTASIRELGLLLPIRVMPADANGRHVIISGHRRFEAMKLLGMTETPCIIVDGPLDEMTILAEQLAENIHRENLSPIEEAQGYTRYLKLKAIPAAQAALELAVPATRISRVLPLLELPVDVQAAIHAGTIAKDTAYHLARLPAGKGREGLISQALAGSLSREAAVRAVKASQPDATDTPAISRASCKLPGNYTLTFSGPKVRLDSFIEAIESVLKEARKARTQGLDVSTLTKMFRDRSAGGAS